ncbi:hypothetical protein L873DRAFT_1847846 [Choiromyces venosus 120613-1]|uniref:Myb-like domain-containing protein n=1 Tax=Choiromyces venosus 120613-1 TaxID=1336337 RepID=A0A3N4J1H5_9PEZI|nr:hypothetical protein L873DRAFT_1847846 [Choiromyces venosus 120613-1]
MEIPTRQNGCFMEAHSVGGDHEILECGEEEEEEGEVVETAGGAASNPTPPTSPAGKKRSSSPPSPPPPPKKARALLPSLPEEIALLLSLKDTQNLPWPRVHAAFAAHGWERKLAVLKGRYKAIKEGGVYWEEEDVDLLFRAVWEVEREFERGRWEAVAARVRSWGGCAGKVGAGECERRWRRGGGGGGGKVEGEEKKEDVMKVESLLE